MIKEIIESRRSIRKFKSEKIPREQIEELIQMAIKAPSASNKQGWRFFIIDESSLIQQMSEQVQKATKEIASHIEEAFLPQFESYGNYFIRFKEAPTVIIPVYRSLTLLSNLVDQQIPSHLLANIQEMEKASGVVSVSLAIQNLMLYAHSIGLGTSCMTGPMVALDEIKTLLKIPKSWDIAAIIPVGYPDETPTSTERKEAQSVIRWVNAT